jgi:flagellar biosynthesis protein FlhF
MQEAMETVKRELGSDAVILNNRKVRKKGWKNLFKRPVLEIMVAYEPEKAPGARRAANPREPEKDQKADSERIKQLDERIDMLDSMLTGFIDKFSFVKREVTYDYAEDVERLLLRLIENQVREELAHRIARETTAVLVKQRDTSAAEVMEQLILEQLGVPEPISHKKFKRKVVLLMGPNGVGKTTSLVKLAANFAIKQQKKVGIINTDTFRIGAQGQLETYTEILDVPLEIVYQMEELTAALENMSDRDIIFIDTAGKRPGDERHREDIQNVIRIAEPEDVLLCVAASTNFSSLKEILDTYGFVDTFRLLITKVDETKFRGMILNISWYAQKRLAYLTTGQNVPDDIEAVDAEAIAGHLLRE